MKLASGLLLDNRAGKIVLGLLLPVLVDRASGRPPARTARCSAACCRRPTGSGRAWKIWAFGPAGMGLNPYSGTWLDNALFSTERVAKGFGVAILFGVPLGIAIGWWRLAAGAFDPTIQVLRPIPITAWLPFSIAVFGIRDMGSVFLIALGAFYPIVINTTQGARGIDKNWIRAALMMGAKPLDVLTRVVLPASLPSIFTGLARRPRHRLDRPSPAPAISARSSSPAVESAGR